MVCYGNNIFVFISIFSYAESISIKIKQDSSDCIKIATNASNNTAAEKAAICNEQSGTWYRDKNDGPCNCRCCRTAAPTENNVRFLGLVINGNKIEKTGTGEDKVAVIKSEITENVTKLRNAMETCREEILQDSRRKLLLENTSFPGEIPVKYRSSTENLKNDKNDEDIYRFLQKHYSEYGINPDNFDLVFLFAPTFSGAQSIVNHKHSYGSKLQAMSHELYHSMGIGHASNMDFSTNNYKEYGNFLDRMGANDTKRLGLAIRHKLGFLHQNSLHTVDPWSADHNEDKIYKFASFKNKTSSKVGVRIKLSCAELYVSRYENGAIIEYAHKMNQDQDDEMWKTTLATTFKRNSAASPEGNYITQEWQVDETFSGNGLTITLKQYGGISVKKGGSAEATYTYRGMYTYSVSYPECGQPPSLTDNCSKSENKIQHNQTLTWVPNNDKYIAVREGYYGEVEYECRQGELHHLSGIWGPQECSNHKDLC